MSVRDALSKRRSVYTLNKNLPVEEAVVIKAIEEAVALVPDAFDCKSQRVIVALNDKQDELWDAIFNAFNEQVPREKIDGFKAAAGTVLYFTDEDVTKGLMDQFPLYAPNFPVWNGHANAMLQLAIWSIFAELGIGANLQHYNPVIDETISNMFGIPENYKLVAQMPFGGIESAPIEKESEDISKRVSIVK